MTMIIQKKLPLINVVEKFEHYSSLESSNKNSIKIPKDFDPKNKIIWLINFGILV